MLHLIYTTHNFHSNFMDKVFQVHVDSPCFITLPTSKICDEGL